MSSESKYTDLKGLRIDRGKKRASNWPRVIILTGFVGFVLLGVAWTAYRRLGQAILEVAVVRPLPERDDAPSPILSAGGYIVAHHKINVNSKVTGRIAWIGVEKGDRVEQGQVLVRLEDTEFRAQADQARGGVKAAEARLAWLENGSRPQEIEQARHNLEQAQADRLLARLQLDRMRGLTAEKVTSQGELDEAVARYDASDQRVRALEKSYELARIGPRVEEIDRARGELAESRGRLAYAEALLEATEIRAPVRGTILERTAEKGELVTAQFASGAAGGPRGSVVSLADLEDLQVELDISQDDIAKLEMKQPGVVTADAYPDRKYEGLIEEIAPEANRQKATVQVKVKILKPDEYLRPEMNARVDFLPVHAAAPSKTNASAVLLPISAVQERGGRKLVFLALQEIAVPKEVQVLGQRTTGYLVGGLTGEENVIVDPSPDLQEGTRIRVKEKP